VSCGVCVLSQRDYIPQIRANSAGIKVNGGLFLPEKLKKFMDYRVHLSTSFRPEMSLNDLIAANGKDFDYSNVKLKAVQKKHKNYMAPIKPGM